MLGSRVRIGGVALLLGGLALMIAFGLTACNTAGGPKTVTVDEVGTINWAAYQDGSGAWQALTGSSFTVSDSAGKYGVAWECPSPLTSGPGVGVIQATMAESTSVLAACPPAPPATWTVSGTISGIPSGGSAVITLGSSSQSVTPASGATSASFTLGVASGVHTLVAYGLDSGGNPSQMVVARDVSIIGNNTNYNVDLASGQAFTMNTVHLTNTPSNLTTSNTSVGAYLVSTGLGDNFLTASASGSADLSYPVLPGALAQASDLYELVGSSSPPDSTGSTNQYVALLAHNPSNGQSVALPTPISSDAAVTVSGSTTTVTWGTATFDGSGGITVHSATDDFKTGASWIVAVTAGWNGSATTYTFPDFSSTAGWNSAWDIPAGQLGDSLVNVRAWHANLTLEQLELFDFSEMTGGGTTSDPNGTLVQTTEHQ